MTPTAGRLRRLTHSSTPGLQTCFSSCSRRNDAQIRIRDAKDQIHNVPTEDIEEIVPARLSIMPTGLTEALSQDEFIDLLSFLAGLGRQQ